MKIIFEFCHFVHFFENRSSSDDRSYYTPASANLKENISKLIQFVSNGMWEHKTDMAKIMWVFLKVQALYKYWK